MRSTPVRIAVAGLRHGAEHLDHYRGRTDVEIAGLCDLDEELLKKSGQEYGAPPRAWFTDFDTMLAQAKPDAVFVMTPVPTHAPLTIKALNAGCHVLVAKSLCRSLAEGAEMIAARNRSGKQVEVGFQMHHAAVYQYLREHLSDPDFGELRGAWIQFFSPSYWRKPGDWQNRMETLGGMLLDCCIHSLDVLLYCLDRPWTRVFASGRQFLAGPPERDTMDAATVLIDLEGGPRLTIDAMDSRAYCFTRTGVVGSTGKFEIEHWDPNGSGHVRFSRDVNAAEKVTRYVPPPEASTGHIGAVELSLHFLDVCRGDAQPKSSLESALESLSAQMAVVHSLRGNRWVDRAEITENASFQEKNRCFLKPRL
jgi:predicted dehydrogenase